MLSTRNCIIKTLKMSKNILKGIPTYKYSRHNIKYNITYSDLNLSFSLELTIVDALDTS